ncbi:MAG: haloalkane dehalogenase [Inquilinaceae bacterium]
MPHRPKPTWIVTTGLALVLSAVSGLAAAQQASEGAAQFEPRPTAAFPYQKQVAAVSGGAIAYVEVGDPVGDPVLFLHGIPTSSYLWRNVLPGVARDGRRLIAMDLVGFGDSTGTGYGVLDQVRHVETFVEALGLQDVTLVTHDWGAGIGLIYAARNPDNVVAFAAMEGALPPVYPRPSYETFGPQGADLFRRMRDPATSEQVVLEDNVWLEGILPNSVAQDIQPDVHDAYRNAFPTAESRQPILDMVLSLPIAGEPADVVVAFDEATDWWKETEIPKLVLYAVPGRLQPQPLAEWAERTLKNVTTAEVGPGVHFIQEDSPRAIGRELDAWLTRLSAADATTN